MSRRGAFAVALVSAVGCSDEPTDSDRPVPLGIDENLVVEGFDGLSVAGSGVWLRQRTVWTDGSHPDEVHHSFLLGEDATCEALTAPYPARPEPTGDPVADCEADRAYYAELSELNSDVGLSFYFQLWDTTRSEDHIGVPPAAGSYHPLGSPGDDPVEYASGGTRVLFDWYAAAADNLDCTAANPWADVPSDLEARSDLEVESGALVLDGPTGDQLVFSLEEVVVEWDGNAVSPGGTLEGRGVFTACDTLRELELSTPTDPYY